MSWTVLAENAQESNVCMYNQLSKVVEYNDPGMEAMSAEGWKYRWFLTRRGSFCVFESVLELFVWLCRLHQGELRLYSHKTEHVQALSSQTCLGYHA